MNHSEPVRVLQIIGIVCGGGVESVIMNYYHHIDREKIQFDFVIDGYGKSILDDEITHLGGKIYKVEPYNHNIFKYMCQIYQIVRDNHYNIIHSNMNTLSIFSLFPAWLAGAKVRIIHNHSTAVKSEKMRSLMKYLLRPFAPLFANHYVACSRIAGEWMYGKKMVIDGKVKVINNAIDVEEFSFNIEKRRKIREQLKIKDDTLVIGHVGRFTYQKNHEFLIEIFKEIYRHNQNVILLLVGDGSLRSNIEQKVKRCKMEEQVRFLGLRKDVKDLYNAMDIFVLPSHYEGLPVVSLEAQANGMKCFFSTNVTNECNIAQQVFFCGLDKSAFAWSNVILNSAKERNEHVKNRIKDSGYDIVEEAPKLMNFYNEWAEK